MIMFWGMCEQTKSISVLQCVCSCMLQESKGMDSFRSSCGVRVDRIKGCNLHCVSFNAINCLAKAQKPSFCTKASDPRVKSG